MKQIPKYSHELIDELDSITEHPQLPKSMKGWQGLNEGELRRGAFLAGRRSLVDDLVLALEEDNVDATAPDTGASSVEPDGIQRSTLAPTRLAQGTLGDDYDTVQREYWASGEWE